MSAKGEQLKVNFGCGIHRLEGWINHDLDVDIRKPLPYTDDAVAFILAEHLVEHVTHQEAWSFFKECHRILVPGGVLRVAVPCVEVLIRNADEDYLEFIRERGWGDGSLESAVRAAIFCHGHKSAWTREMLCVLLRAMRYDVSIVGPHGSRHPELHDVDGHWKSVGGKLNAAETGIVEAVKRARGEVPGERRGLAGSSRASVRGADSGS